MINECLPNTLVPNSPKAEFSTVIGCPNVNLRWCPPTAPKEKPGFLQASLFAQYSHGASQAQSQRKVVHVIQSTVVRKSVIELDRAHIRDTVMDADAPCEPLLGISEPE